MQNKRIVVLPLMIIIALSIFGFVYAHWSDMVTVQGEVEMGSLTLAWDISEVLVSIDRETWEKDKNVSWAKIYYDLPASYVEDVHTGKNGCKTLVFEIYNAYPQYWVHFTTVTVHNIGNVPLNITGINVWDPTGYLNWTWIVSPPFSPAEGVFWRDFNTDGDRDPDTEDIMNVLIKNFVFEQLDPCEAKKGEVDIDFKQPAEQCHTYRFMMSIEAMQWNKA